MVRLTALCVEQFAGSLANSVDSLNYSVVPERATKWYLTVCTPSALFLRFGCGSCLASTSHCTPSLPQAVPCS